MIVQNPSPFRTAKTALWPRERTPTTKQAERAACCSPSHAPEDRGSDRRVDIFQLAPAALQGNDAGHRLEAWVNRKRVEIGRQHDKGLIQHFIASLG